MAHEKRAEQAVITIAPTVSLFCEDKEIQASQLIKPFLGDLRGKKFVEELFIKPAWHGAAGKELFYIVRQRIELLELYVLKERVRATQVLQRYGRPAHLHSVREQNERAGPAL